MLCLYCQKYFARRGRKKYCSSLHRYRYWIKLHPERAHEINRKWKQKNIEKRKEYGRKYISEHKEEMRVKLFAWRRKNRAKTVQQVLLRRYREKGINGSHTLEQWQELKKRYDYRCAICRKKKQLTRDHIIPVTKKGATNDISNIQPLCRQCNSRKFNHI